MGGIHSTLGGYLEYIGGAQYIKGPSWSTSGVSSKYIKGVQYIGGLYGGHWGDTQYIGWLS